MHFGDSPFELPTNTDLEKILKKNTEHTNPLELKGYKTDDGKDKVFPFWTPVKDSGGVTSVDYTDYWDNKDKAVKGKKDKVGSVTPMDASKSYENVSLLDKIKGLIQNQHSEMNDNSGVIEKKSENMDVTKSSKPDVVNKVDEPMTPVVDMADKAKVGKKESGNMGAVKPKEDMGTQTKTDVTKGSGKAKGDNVGVVKQPKTGTLANPTDINFDKFKTDSIKKP